MLTEESIILYRMLVQITLISASVARVERKPVQDLLKVGRWLLLERPDILVIVCE